MVCYPIHSNRNVTAIINEKGHSDGNRILPATHAIVHVLLQLRCPLILLLQASKGAVDIRCLVRKAPSPSINCPDNHLRPLVDESIIVHLLYGLDGSSLLVLFQVVALSLNAKHRGAAMKAELHRYACLIRCVWEGPMKWQSVLNVNVPWLAENWHSVWKHVRPTIATHELLGVLATAFVAAGNHPQTIARSAFKYRGVEGEPACAIVRTTPISPILIPS